MMLVLVLLPVPPGRYSQRRQIVDKPQQIPLQTSPDMIVQHMPQAVIKTRIIHT